jgi:chromate transport protein ChrA
MFVTYVYKWMYVCEFVCMFGHNSATPGAISTKLGTHMALCMYKNLMYTFYIYIYLLSINFAREFG